MTELSWLRVHHVLLAMPSGREDEARAFYVGVLGLREIPKPQVLAARGGAWFHAGGVELHLGVEEGFAPARKAHPGLEVADLDGLVARVAAAGIEVRPDDDLPRHRRVYIDDPFGNRLELLERTGGHDVGVRSYAARGPAWVQPWAALLAELLRLTPASPLHRVLRRRTQ